MGIFDSIKSSLNQTASNAAITAVRKASADISRSSTSPVTNAARNNGLKSNTITFDFLPENLSQLQTLPDAQMTDPFKTVAFAVAAFCRYGEDAESAVEMLNYLKGPQPLSAHELSFIRDRYMDGKKYIPYSYFEGASPQNNYVPTQPYKVTIREDAHSNDEDGYIKLFIQSSGADSPRPVKLRRKGDGMWCLWEFSSILSGIRIPVANDPWA